VPLQPFDFEIRWHNQKMIQRILNNKVGIAIFANIEEVYNILHVASDGNYQYRCFLVKHGN